MLDVNNGLLMATTKKGAQAFGPPSSIAWIYLWGFSKLMP
jgi:hypothetical protein